MMTGISNTLFKLPSDASQPPPSCNLTRLEGVVPHFLLPRLEEGSAGDERLLASLRIPQYTSDEKTVIPAAQLRDEEEAPSDSSPTAKRLAGKAIWQQVRDEQASGTHQAVFEPIRTWDTRDFETVQSREPRLLSEASTFTYEAFLSSNEIAIVLPTLVANLPPKGEDSKSLLNLMARATLGATTSECLKWDERQYRYTWIMDRRIAGVSRSASNSAIDQFLKIATMIRRLESTISDLNSRPSTSTHHAMLHALSTYLTYMKDRLSTAAEDCISEERAGWVKWCSAMKEVEDLATTLCDTIHWPIEEARPVPLPTRSSSLITHIHSHLLSHISTSQTTPSSLALAYIISLSSRPVLYLLHQWVGLADSNDLELDLSPDHQPWADLGITRTPTNSRENVWTYEFSSRRMPGFIPREIRKTLFEAGKSLRMLREASEGQHPLCTGQWGFDAEWRWGTEERSRSSATLRSHLRRVEREAKYWRKSLNPSISTSASATSVRRTPRKERKKIPPAFLGQTTRRSESEHPSLDQGESRFDTNTKSTLSTDLFQLFDSLPGSNIDKTQSNPLWAPTPLTILHTFLSRSTTPGITLLPIETPTLQLFITERLLAPLLAHAKIVSTCLVSLYIDDLNLLDHLDVLRAYFLGGDVDFSERVTSALFGRDEAGAGEALGAGKRARTRARLGIEKGQALVGKGEMNGEWGIGLGLGLSERARWPPGGAELAYALRTTLMGDDRSGKVHGEVWEGVEDRVSFAVKDLPEDDAGGKRARWMNPQAIEALDFLYLSYSPPPTIAHLLPKPLMTKYQTIHNLLLRISRVQLVLRTIYTDITHLTPSNDISKRGVDDRSRPNSRNSQSQPKNMFHFGNTVHTLRFRMSGFMDAFGRYIIDRAIGCHWGVMRRRLSRLRRKHVASHESRSGTPDSPTGGAEHFEGVDDDLSDEEDHHGEDGPARIQLHSIHSLVAYHHLTLDKILRATLQAPSAGQQVTSKVMMSMFGLILDLGKLIKLIQRGSVVDGEERVKEIKRDWDEREEVFMHALGRLSVRTATRDDDMREDGDPDLKAQEEDLRLLMSGQKEDGEDHATEGNGEQDLQDLLLRLRMGSAHTRRGGRYAAAEEI